MLLIYLFTIFKFLKFSTEVEQVEDVTVGNFDFSPWGESKLPKVQTGYFPRTDFQNFWHKVRP